eukprot:TRINITY_DN8023_c0_g1_i1.p1 TRINITY_DN8023_c0_g1~~TRINITY_DN8023_c0_g1_i1.p1  ORF type:complete len:740 (+),score=131.63 TRINITY_DN8023_c0_g1_i1:63-2282(+)
MSDEGSLTFSPSGRIPPVPPTSARRVPTTPQLQRNSPPANPPPSNRSHRSLESSTSKISPIDPSLDAETRDFSPSPSDLNNTPPNTNRSMFSHMSNSVQRIMRSVNRRNDDAYSANSSHILSQRRPQPRQLSSYLSDSGHTGYSQEARSTAADPHLQSNSAADRRRSRHYSPAGPATSLLGRSLNNPAAASSNGRLLPFKSFSNREKEVFVSMLLILLVVFCSHPKVYSYIDHGIGVFTGRPSFEDSLTEAYCRKHPSKICVKFLHDSSLRRIKNTLEDEVRKKEQELQQSIAELESYAARRLGELRQTTVFKSDLLKPEEYQLKINEIALNETNALLSSHLNRMRNSTSLQVRTAVSYIKKQIDFTRFDAMEKYIAFLRQEFRAEAAAMEAYLQKWEEDKRVALDKVIVKETNAILKEAGSLVEQTVKFADAGLADSGFDAHVKNIVDTKARTYESELLNELQRTALNMIITESMVESKVSGEFAVVEELSEMAEKALHYPANYVSSKELPQAIRSAAMHVDLDKDDQVVKSPVFIPQPVIVVQKVESDKPVVKRGSKNPDLSAPAYEFASKRPELPHLMDPEFNYASELHGATLYDVSAQGESWSVGLLRRVFQHNLASNAIQPSLKPGDCWAAINGQASLVVKLSQPVVVKRFALSHSPAALFSKSVPKEFTIRGLNDDGENILLGQFLFDPSLSYRQEYAIENPHKLDFAYVEFSVDSNHGGEYSCIYYIEVLGA